MSDTGGFDFGRGPAKREPNADIRLVTRALNEFYTGLKDEGFSRREALELTVVFLQETLRKGMDDHNG